MNTTEQQICNLELDQAENAMNRQRVVEEKSALQAELAEIKAACTIRLPNKEYHQLQKRRADIVRQLMEKERDLSQYNRKNSEIHAVGEVRRRQSGLIVAGDAKKLVEMRDHWHAFSMDPKNHQKAREVAYKCSQELRELLREYFTRQ